MYWGIKDLLEKYFQAVKQREYKACIIFPNWKSHTHGIAFSR
jgi:hypothetical protein